MAQNIFNSKYSLPPHFHPPLWALPPEAAATLGLPSPHPFQARHCFLPQHLVFPFSITRPCSDSPRARHFILSFSQSRHLRNETSSSAALSGMPTSVLSTLNSTDYLSTVFSSPSYSTTIRTNLFGFTSRISHILPYTSFHYNSKHFLPQPCAIGL